MWYMDAPSRPGPGRTMRAPTMGTASSKKCIAASSIASDHAKSHEQRSPEDALGVEVPSMNHPKFC